jgi:hypothetical protein
MSEHDDEDEPARPVPDEVRRLRLEPGERLVVRNASLAPIQVHEYQEYLQAWFPDNEVLVLVADEVFVERAAPAPYWITVQGGNTIMSDADLSRFAEKIVKRVLQERPPVNVRKDDDPDDGLAGVPTRG